MAELGTPQSSGLFQDWYDRYVKPKKFSLETPAPSPETNLPGPSVPTPEAPAVSPAMPVEPVNPSPGEGSLSERIGAGIDRVGEGLKNPTRMGLLATGLSMMATPPRQVRYSNTEVLGNAGLAGLKYYETALEAKRKDELMKQTAEEHTLTREDRRQANEDRAAYYRDTAETRQQNAETLAQQRETMNAYRKSLQTNAELLGAPVPDAVWDGIGRPEMKGKGITGNQFKEYGLGALNRPPGMAVVTNDKGDVTIAPKVPGVLPGAGKSKTQPAGAGGEGPGKSAAIALINKEVVSQYLPIARDEISKSAPPGSEKMRQMVESLNTQDPTTGGPNEAKVREHLSPKQREELDFVKRKAQDYSKTMVPAVAVQKARDEWTAAHPAPKTDARYEEYRKVYEEIRNYSGWTNAEKNAKIKEMNDKARKMGLIN